MGQDFGGDFSSCGGGGVGADGFGFDFDASACESCGGKCCAGERGAVWISEDECAAAAAFVGVGVTEFKVRFTRILNGRRSLREVVDGGGNSNLAGGGGENRAGNGGENRAENCAEILAQNAPKSNLAVGGSENFDENSCKNGENLGEFRRENDESFCENGVKNGENRPQIPCKNGENRPQNPRQNQAVPPHTQISWACEFLDQTTRRCAIYPVRPRQCRTFPFWSAFRGDFSELAAECAGVRPAPNAQTTPRTTQQKGKK